LVRDYGAQLLVVALDTDENPVIPERYQIMGLPTLLFLRGGVEIDRQVGLCTYEELQAKVEALLA
jgi:thioredoxin 1